MDISTKVKINIKEGTIELEGTESFVGKYLEEFKKYLHLEDNLQINQNESDGKQEKPHISTKEADVKKKQSSGKSAKVAPTIKVEEFDVEGSSDTPSLKDFLDEKQPGDSAALRILVLGYYITKTKNKSHFTEGNIEFAYRALNLNKRPAFLRQIIVNQKNEKQWFKDNENGWVVTRIGELYVEQSLPLAIVKHAS